MATFHRRAPKTLTATVHLDGEPFALYLRKPSTPELLALTAALAAFRRSIKGADVGRDAYELLLDELADQVARVDGLLDEDGAPVDWAALTVEDRAALLGELNFKEVMDLTNMLATSGRLGVEEKKASEPTPPRSSEAPAADALAAPAASMPPA